MKKDYYTRNSSRLNGQPKRTIADYVEQNGFLVPRRFDSLEDARKSHKAIILRSEHPQEYAGVSGLLDSFGLSRDSYFNVRGVKSLDDAKESYFEEEESGHGTPGYLQYCHFLNLDSEQFIKDTSFSVWEKLGGVNRTVIADSSIEGRHHIMSCKDQKKDGYGRHYNYTIVDNGEITKEFCSPLLLELKSGIKDLVGKYEAIRNLEHFNPGHCPIMEFQTLKGKDYFLQYHRTRDFFPVTFTLDRSKKKGEVEAMFVRGATESKGWEGEINVVSASNYHRESPKIGDIHISNGTYDLDLGIAPCVLYPRREIQMMHTSTSNVDSELLKIVLGHNSRSELFKPGTSLIHDMEKIVSLKEHGKMLKRARETNEDQGIFARIISDGKNAYIKRLA